MKATLTFNLPEDSHEFDMANQGAAMHSVLWEMDQWLRGNIKHAPDSMSDDEYKAYERCREELRELMFENGVKFD
jgi:hypothetical protein